MSLKMKHCYKCDEYKYEDEFYKNKSKYDGLSSECKQCTNKRSLEYISKNKIWQKEEIKEKVSKYQNY